ncbi:right-handed parallel beta-helix repeat-containing protein [Paenibacillus sp. H1-7]|uniref:right-handed parallel beta-helix repeat-containing protein n=1 Tax=Paenibacillus sp. H1-7 TaxID=2282849 RepID=UPI001EF78FF6|nr:right-handed parallel beta-helix repeat-containing protein [Paenibacillus sp. H1-7]ULL15944.1 right-handed parallel beta-helix repeat-containing protein [Paenibacillus sp. H1-7]
MSVQSNKENESVEAVIQKVEEESAAGREHKQDALISRRKLLAVLGMGGAAAITAGLWKGAGAATAYANEMTVTQSVYDQSKKVKPKELAALLDEHLCLAVKLEELRAETDPDSTIMYYVTNEGQEGFFRYDPNDSTTPDNTGTVAVSTNGCRFKRIYEDTLIVSWFGTKADGVTNDTQALQAALNAASGRKLFIPKQRAGYYLTGQLFIPGQIAIELEPGTIIQAVDTLSRVGPAYERLIRIKTVKDVYINGNGATFRMNKAAYTSGEQAHIFDISGSENVVIENVNANDSGGDGFYVGYFESTVLSCKNIVLRNCKANNNRRQGLSVISVDGLLVESCRFTNTKGTAPQSGVDIEPNSQLDLLKNIRFVQCVAEGNTGRGFLVTLLKPTALSESIDIVFDRCKTKGNSYGFSMNYGGDGAKAVPGEIKLIDCIAENEQYSGFSDLSFSADSAKRSYIRCRAINCNTVNQPDDPYSNGSSFILTTVPQQVRTSIGNAVYVDCESVDLRSAPLMKRGFTLRKNKTELIRNVQYFNCSVLGGGQSLYSIDPSTEDLYAENRPVKVRAFTASGSLSFDYTGFQITNAGASGDIVLTLPAAKASVAFQFYLDSPFRLSLAASSGGSIITPAGVKSSIGTAAAGSSVSLMGRADGSWAITGMVGDWS